MALGKEINNFVKMFLATSKMGWDRDYRERRLALEEKKAAGMSPEQWEQFLSRFGVGGNRSGGASSSGGGRDVTSDPALTSLEPHQKAFLNAVAGPESAGAYNVRYGGAGGAKTFQGYDAHPNIREVIASGPNAGKTSDAAGRYQFLSSTWNSLPREAKGDGKFTPENQDRAAWFLAQRDYKARTGRELDADLRKDGLTTGILGNLSGTWEGFKTDPSSALRAYKNSIGKYSTQKSAESNDNVLGPTQAPTVEQAGGVSGPSTGAVPLPPRRPDNLTPQKNAEAETALPMEPQNTAEVAPEAEKPMEFAQAEPAQTALPMEEETTFAARGGMIEPQNDQALRAALFEVQNSMGPQQAALPDGSRGQRMASLQKGEGAISPDAYDALRKSVDPDGMNPNATRDAMNKIYGFYVAKGDKAAAAKVAAGVLQAARNRSMEFGQMAGDALEKKNYPLAARALAAAYNEVPDGKRVTAEVNEQGVGRATVMDANTDKVVEQMELNPRTLGVATMQFMGGNEFYAHLASSLGRAPDRGIGNG